MEKAIVCNIEKYAIHDGPGIRTVVFLKGCPLRCSWCSNPETQQKENELFYNKSTCQQCGTCVNACPKGALSLTENGIIIDRDKCDLCGICVSVCPTKSLSFVGKKMDVEQVYKEVMKDRLFYEQSGGGVTASGGEVLMNTSFVTELFKRLKDEYIHTTVETTGFGDTKQLLALSEYTDLFLFDVKHTDREDHKKWTGVDNNIILKNLEVLAKANKKIIIRVPLIPEINDSVQNIQETINIAKRNGIKEIHLLPYHTLGVEKYNRLQRKYTVPLEKRDHSFVEELKRMIEDQNLTCVVGG